MATRSALNSKYAEYSHIEPLPDPEQVNGLEQFDGVLFFVSAMKAYFGDRDDVLVSGDGYLCFEASGSMAGWLVPDCVVTFDVEARAITARNGYVINEVGKAPDFVLEVASRTTGRRDYTVKRDGYAGYGVREYWRFDHTGGDYHDAAIAGDLLVDGEYQPLEIVEEADGMKWGHSAILGLDLCWVEKMLRIRNPETGEFLPTPIDWRSQMEAAEAERDAAESGRIVAEAELDAERASRVAAEAEAERLREELRQLRQGQR